MSAVNLTVDRPLNLEHPMHNGVTFEIVRVTPEIAQEWLGHNHGNRSQRATAISMYARDMRHGDWLFTGDPIRFDWDGRLIDGQHRLEGVVISGVTVVMVVIRGLDPRVQGVLDTNAKRTMRDALTFAGIKSGVNDLATAARIAQAYESGALEDALSNIPSNNLSNTEGVEWALQNPDAIGACLFAHRVARKIGATSGSLGYCVLRLMRVDPEKAIDFFEGAAEMRTNGRGDPRKAMLDAFTAIRNKRRAPSPAETLAIVFRCWDAWYHDATLRSVNTIIQGSKGMTVWAVAGSAVTA